MRQPSRFHWMPADKTLCPVNLDKRLLPANSRLCSFGVWLALIQDESSREGYKGQETLAELNGLRRERNYEILSTQSNLDCASGGPFYGHVWYDPADERGPGETSQPQRSERTYRECEGASRPLVFGSILQFRSRHTRRASQRPRSDEGVLSKVRRR